MGFDYLVILDKIDDVDLLKLALFFNIRLESTLKEEQRELISLEGK